MTGRRPAEARLGGDSSEELSGSRGWTLQVAGTFGEVPLLMGNKIQSPILLPRPVSILGGSLLPLHLLWEQSALVGRLPPWWSL